MILDYRSNKIPFSDIEEDSYFTHDKKLYLKMPEFNEGNLPPIYNAICLTADSSISSFTRFDEDIIVVPVKNIDFILK